MPLKGWNKKYKSLSLPCTDFEARGSAASSGLYSCKTEENDIQSTIIDPLLHSILRGVESFATRVWSVYPADEKESFTIILQHLLAECRWKQYQQASVVLPRDKDKDHPCSYDGVRPAVVSVRFGDEKKLISRAVDIRRTEGRILRNRIYEDLLKQTVSDPRDDRDSWIFTDDFDTLSRRKEAEKRDGKIAFIYE